MSLVIFLLPRRKKVKVEMMGGREMLLASLGTEGKNNGGEMERINGEIRTEGSDERSRAIKRVG